LSELYVQISRERERKRGVILLTTKTLFSAVDWRQCAEGI
jgi:hypothetical protein